MYTTSALGYQTMKIALLAVSGKPYHSGHDGLVRKAASENDRVMLFVSTSDRERPGEVPIKGSDMAHIWKSYIEPTLPDNVIVEYGGSPVRKIYDLLGKANETHSKNTYVVYSDPQDLAQNFPEKNMVKYLGDIWKNKQVKLVPVQRTSTVNVSGTKMREFLAKGDKKSFLQNLPQEVDGNAIWNILSKHRTEAFLRDYIKLVLI